MGATLCPASPALRFTPCSTPCSSEPIASGLTAPVTNRLAVTWPSATPARPAGRVASASSTALGCNAPVLCLTGQTPSAFIGKGRGHLHELPDQLGVLGRLTKWAARIE